jgi:hypothetical protein
MWIDVEWELALMTTLTMNKDWKGNKSRMDDDDEDSDDER